MTESGRIVDWGSDLPVAAADKNWARRHMIDTLQVSQPYQPRRFSPYTLRLGTAILPSPLATRILLGLFGMRTSQFFSIGALVASCYFQTTVGLTYLQSLANKRETEVSNVTVSERQVLGLQLCATVDISIPTVIGPQLLGDKYAKFR
jgi:hypothetical protein